MTDPLGRTDAAEDAADSRQPVTSAKKPVSMHEDVPVWHDCCCCEAEPYWAAVADELGIDLDAGWNTAADCARS